MAKRLSARSTHDPNITQDASEITATDIPQDDGSTKRGMDVVAKGTLKTSGFETAIKITTQNVTDTATALPATALTDRNSMSVSNLDTKETLYVGPSNVEASDTVGGNGGWEIPSGESLNIDISDSVILYAIAPSGQTIKVKILETA